jgi:cell division protein FtsI (penicillin-binding protein 3)
MRQRKEYAKLNLDSGSIFKLLTVLFFLNAAIIVLIFKLVNIQFFKHSEYSELADTVQLRTIPVHANRGKIIDSKGIILATNKKSLEIAVDPQIINLPKNVNKKNKFLVLISKVTNKSVNYYLNKINNTDSRYVILAKDINIKHKQAFQDVSFFGLRYNEISERSFPYDNLAAHVIGFTNKDGIGISGIERQYDTILKGIPGFIVLKRDLKRDFHAGAELPSSKSKDGHNVQLTIDSDLQSIVEYELKMGMELTQSEGGSVIIMNPNTGEILALASSPSFNPNVSAERIPDNVRNRAINDEYEPGSTFKLITACAALEEKLVTPERVFSGYGGSYTIGGRTITDVHGYGNITFRDAVEKSSNIVFSQVAALIPRNTFYKYIRDFGFGLLTDIELPGEAKGRVPRPEKISMSLQRSIGYGYAISTTPLQVLCAYCAAANGGTLVKPYLIKSIFDNENNYLYEAKPKKIRRVLSKETSQLIGDLFTGIVDRGTGKAVKIENLKIAGKTGTSSQLVDGSYSTSHYNASFVGFFPVENPQLAMIIVLDSPKGSYYGGTTAAPIFRNIALRIINSSNILARAKLYMK